MPSYSHRLVLGRTSAKTWCEIVVDMLHGFVQLVGPPCSIGLHQPSGASVWP
jgi:hypothetical protein